MWKEIWYALKGDDDLTEMVAQVGQMLDNGHWMFEKAGDALMHESNWQAVADELYPKDKEINKIERTVRGQIVTHLSIGSKADLGACLMLMSVVKDAERIGDYCKNIFEVAKFYKYEYTRAEFANPLADIRDEVLPLFAKAKQAFTDTDPNLANAVLDTAGGLTKKCDLLIQQLLSVHEEFAPDEAVAYVLISRFYKRVTAHLANIATSVVSPVPMLDYDYRDES